MTPDSVAREWRAHFGSTLPAGFLCRVALPDRWLRIHSLPRSKRYPETEAERKELLARHNAAASYTLGAGAACLLFVTRFGGAKPWSSSEQLVLGDAEPVMSFRQDVDEEELLFFARPVTWRSGAFDEVVLAVAEENVGPVLFANMARGCAYAPYDGGADLFFASSDATNAARNNFANWLPERADGL